MRAILILSATVCLAAEPTDTQRVRAKAALALAFAPPTYAEQHAKALKEGKPLVVFVGQPAKIIAGSVLHNCEVFPDVPKRGVVVGLPDGTALRRVDLPGTPSEDSIRQTLTITSRTEIVGKLPAK
jgi:hypothetical protein